MAVIAASSNEASARGRLNFMLENSSGSDISYVTIAPSRNSDFKFGNLIKEQLRSGQKIYIGPNFYSDFKLWDISVRQKGGGELTFKDNKLTRYNTYTLRQGANGASLVQTYRKANSRPRSLDARVDASDESGNRILLGQPEQMASAEKITTPGEDWDSPQQYYAVSASIDLTRGGGTWMVTPDAGFISGDKVRLRFSTNQDGYAYWLSRGSSGSYSVLFPSKEGGTDNRVRKGLEYAVPEKGAWRFDDHLGEENLVFVFSSDRIEALEGIAAGILKGDQKASESLGRAMDRFEQMRIEGRLEFKEENGESRNLRSQVKQEGNPMICFYVLDHSS